jgi:hypothetical protein
MLHVERESLVETGEPGMCELGAGVVEVAKDAGGGILALGRRARVVSGSLRRALEVRDRGCRFPGCGLRYTDAHHIVH